MALIWTNVGWNAPTNRLTDLSLEDAALFLGAPLLGIATSVSALFAS